MEDGECGKSSIMWNISSEWKMSSTENARHRKQTIVLSAIFILIIVLRISDMQEKLS